MRESGHEPDDGGGALADEGDRHQPGGAQPRERLTTLRNRLARLPRGTRFWRTTEWLLYRIVRDGSQE
jgi:hypothetical protein